MKQSTLSSFIEKKKDAHFHPYTLQTEPKSSNILSPPSDHKKPVTSNISKLPVIHIMYASTQTELFLRSDNLKNFIDISLSDVLYNESHGYTGVTDLEILEEVLEETFCDEINEKMWYARVTKKIKENLKNDSTTLVINYIGKRHACEKIKWVKGLCKGTSVFGRNIPKWYPKTIYIVDEIGSKAIQDIIKFCEKRDLVIIEHN